MKPFKRAGKKIEKAIFSRGNGSYGNRQYFPVLVQRSDTPEKLTRLCKSLQIRSKNKLGENIVGEFLRDVRSSRSF